MTHCIFIGMDVHQKSIDIAVADGTADGQVRHYGTIGGQLKDVDHLIGRLGYKKDRLRMVYEAGPCGYGLYRHLTAQAINCTVVAPSLTPRKAGDRVKTDRRDSLSLARLHRAAELTAIYVPRPQDEAMRDLSRAREDAKISEKKAKQRLNSFLLSHGIIYSGLKKWSVAHRRWLAGLCFDDPGQQIVFQEYIDSIEECERRVQRITDQLGQRASQWRMAPVVQALQVMRGVSLIAAVTLVSELGDLRRFDHPQQLMAYLGLVPSEHSSGERRRQAGITKCGNTHARRVLVQCAWSYRFAARMTRELRERRQRLAPEIGDIGWKAQVRLCGRYRRLIAKGKSSQVAVTAIAREMSAFLWAIARRVPIAA